MPDHATTPSPARNGHATLCPSRRALPRLSVFVAALTAVFMLSTGALPLQAQEAKRRQDTSAKASAAPKSSTTVKKTTTTKRAAKTDTAAAAGTPAAADANAGAAGAEAAAAGTSAATAESPAPATAANGQADEAAAAAVSVQNETAQALLANSPFMSKAFKERLAKSDTNRARDLAFRGFAGNAGNWLICIHNNKSKESRWVKLGEQVDGITIAEFDPSTMRIKVIKDATSTFLKLEEQR